MVSKTFGDKSGPLATGDLDAVHIELEQSILGSGASVAALQSEVQTRTTEDANLQTQVNTKVDLAGGPLTSGHTAPDVAANVNGSAASGKWLINADSLNAILAAFRNSLPTTNPDPANAPQALQAPIIGVRGGGAAVVSAVLEYTQVPTFAGAPRTPDSVIVGFKSNGANPSNHVASSVVTMTIASPCVVTTAVDFADGKELRLHTTGALPTGLTTTTPVFWKRTNATTGQVALTAGGASINTSGSQSGSHTAYPATITVAAADDGEIFSALAEGVKATYANALNPSNQIQINPQAPIANSTAPVLSESAGVYTLTSAASHWTPSGGVRSYEFRVASIVVASGVMSGSTVTYLKSAADEGKPIQGFVTYSHGGLAPLTVPSGTLQVPVTPPVTALNVFTVPSGNGYGFRGAGGVISALKVTSAGGTRIRLSDAWNAARAAQTTPFYDGSPALNVLTAIGPTTLEEGIWIVRDSAGTTELTAE